MNKIRAIIILLSMVSLCGTSIFGYYSGIILVLLLGILFNLDYLLVLLGITKKITIAELKASYQYKSDTTVYGVNDYWTVMYKDANGKYIGDCEDYIATLMNHVEGFEKLNPYKCLYKNETHMIGILENCWIDCGTQILQPMDKMSKYYTEVERLYFWSVYIRLYKSWFVLGFATILKLFKKG